MIELFDSFVLKNLEIQNRLMRSATTSYWSDEDGILRSPILDYYQKLVNGGLGFIVKGHSYVTENGKAHTGQSGLTSDKHIPQMAKITELAHGKGIPILAQINHAGYSSIVERITASTYKTDNWIAREVTIDEIQTIIEAFANAAELAIQAGFDGVQIHGAHGYLVSQFLSDNVNRRKDKYGGSLHNRTRLLLEIFTAIKKKIGNAPIIAIKMNCDDFAPERGITIADSIQIAHWLDEKGIDLIEISGGGPKQDNEIRKIRGRTFEEKKYFEASFAGHAEKIRKTIPSVPLALVDGFRSRLAMDAALAENLVDFISISKPTIIEPDLPIRLMNGQKESSCTNCRICLSKERFGKIMLSCAQNK
ncbi:MAG: NADH:flavin oxidoreductase [Candidatus Heimdallarchaeota archaeon]|nr:NADH:flavin oxidoreductase [Candidatus Heimdallarchaeota archaeon]